MNKNLSKEDFWNIMYTKIPLATQCFCEWIDTYKAETGWKEKAPDWKFHDLPIEMQIGVLMLFFEDHNLFFDRYPTSLNAKANMVETMLFKLNEKLFK